ncbi:radical SAM protein [Eubacterium oxidoreducens]|uniref:Radical SAM superfamily enzyme, MoaA/NifB/PqqE/SkfB family n=1 Tax=Eubacterium oxidoreducens TaxID=1732 RepID=A0A1G6AV61_EUBOX|nr:radical SAM protein [Eubacterium oxidoreducens]SDB12222.1 Radical SAM superfamily enzyme, MoaA/NifB/PqqE/SkfB family [Eubacterium oxidoreducens]
MDALSMFGGAAERLTQKALEQRIPISSTFELLPTCNMRCKMCYIVHQNLSKEQIKKVEFWDSLCDEMIAEGLLFLLVTGGEPLTYPWFRELMERLAKKPVHIALNTNGTLIDDKMADFLMTIYPYQVNISLYGASDETYEKLCGMPGGFSKVSQAIQRLLDRGMKVELHTTMVPDNVHEKEAIAQLAEEWEVPLKMTHYMFPPYRKEERMGTASYRLTPRKAAEVAFWNVCRQLQNPANRKQAFELLCNTFDNPKIYGAYGRKGILCRGGLASSWVDYQGRISGCGISNYEQIDLNKVSFKRAWDQLVSQTEQIEVSMECRICPYRCICSVCVAAAYCETSDVGGTPKYLCEMAKEYARLIKKEYEELKGL